MPSQTWILAQPGAAPSDNLPVYTKNSLPPPYGHGKKLSTILEDEEDDTCLTGPGPFYSWDIARAVAAEYATMIPQALLVDASSTLCAYLYFTSLRARMAIQQQVLLETIHGICSAFPQEGASGALATCSQAIADQQAIQRTLIPGPIAHHTVLLTVVVKALFGWVALKTAQNHIRPFDYLVASGAAHCLLLYCCFFVPLTNALAQAAHVSTWPSQTGRIILIACIFSACLFAHWSLVGLTSRKQAIALPENATEDEKVVVTVV